MIEFRIISIRNKILYMYGKSRISKHAVLKTDSFPRSSLNPIDCSKNVVRKTELRYVPREHLKPYEFRVRVIKGSFNETLHYFLNRDGLVLREGTYTMSGGEGI